MLKIKDNVDLKELKKFGFEQNGILDYEKRTYTFTIMCLQKTRELYYIRENSDIYIKRDFDTLYDLIKADLVEKIED